MTKDDTARGTTPLRGTKPAPDRGRKPNMTFERIAAAVEPADGLTGLSMRRVADRLVESRRVCS